MSLRTTSYQTARFPSTALFRISSNTFAAAAITTAAPAMSWYHAEGATGSLFDTFILLANPNARAASVSIGYFTDSGVTVSRTKEIPAYGRLTINIEDEAPELANAAVATRVTTDVFGDAVPIVSERG